MYQQRFIDGTPVDPQYAKAIAVAVSGACAAEEIVPLDELEAFAEHNNAAQATQGSHQ